MWFFLPCGYATDGDYSRQTHGQQLIQEIGHLENHDANRRHSGEGGGGSLESDEIDTGSVNCFRARLTESKYVSRCVFYQGMLVKTEFAILCKMSPAR